ncbi:hypothetical protein EK21DRAFT_26172, partial [Setomelanomma holmii]
FHALSYVWGPRAKRLPITLNNKRFLVQQNLYSALPYLTVCCMQGTRQMIWIDAICINQENVEEKAAQIALMSSIYRQAQSVWVWFGVAEEQKR